VIAAYQQSGQPTLTEEEFTYVADLNRNCAFRLMQFVVPQFIDVEDKIIGPISVRQFLTLLVAPPSFYQLPAGLQNFLSQLLVFAVSSIGIFALSAPSPFQGQRPIVPLLLAQPVRHHAETAAASGTNG
jgi:hypothetical protein